MLKQIGVYNRIPKEKLEELAPPLEKNEVAQFRILQSSIDPTVPGKVRFPASVKIPSLDVIVIDGQRYDIGLVTAIDQNGAVTGVKYIKVAGQQDSGYFGVTGGKIADDEAYTYYKICNYNESNPNRDKSIDPIFKEINLTKDASNDRKKRSKRLEAMTAAENMHPSEVNEFTAARGWNEDDHETVKRDRIEKFAETDPEGFIKAWGDKDQIVKATIKRALDRGIISHDIAEGKVCWKSGETIYVLPKKEGVNPIDQMADFIASNSKKASNTYDQIKKELKSDEVPA